MDTTILSGLLNNSALLLTMYLVYDIFFLDREPTHPLIQKFITGIIIGMIGIAVMFNPWQWHPGIIFDTRSVLLSVSGLFFGMIPAVVAMIMTLAYRLYLGGNGVWMGISVILLSGVIGIVWRRLRDKGMQDISLGELYVFGLVVHLVMLAAMALLPGHLISETLVRVGLPVMLIYPIGTALLGKLMSGRLQRRQVEQSLRESEERWQFALEGSGDGVWDRDIASGRVFYSDKWKRMLGFAPHEIENRIDAWKNLIHPDDYERVMMDLQSHLRSETPLYLSEYRIKCRDGSYKWILARGKVISRNDRGEPCRIVGTHSDVTDRRHLEEQLRQAQKMEAVGRLAGGVAHDFNNILTTIIGRIYLLREGLAGQEDLLSHADQIGIASERAAGLTRSLLAFSREQRIDPRRISLNDAIKKASGLITRLVREDIEITLRLDESRPVVVADEGQLLQVLMNLVANAKDAIDGPGNIRIETDTVSAGQEFITSQGVASPGDYAVLTITDSGAGMDDKTKERIFEPFFTTKEVGKGTGLGLAVVYGIVRQHNGHIDVRSEPGEGTAFSLYLPLLGNLAADPDEGRDAPIPGGSGTILVAEDEDSVRWMLMAVLKESGYQVIEAENGVDAVIRYREHRDRIDAVLLDVIMPRMNGREACDEILGIQPEAKILFMSGYPRDVLDSAMIQNGEFGFIQKPLRPHELLLQLKEVLQRPASDSGGTSPG